MQARRVCLIVGDIAKGKKISFGNLQLKSKSQSRAFPDQGVKHEFSVKTDCWDKWPGSGEQSEGKSDRKLRL